MNTRDALPDNTNTRPVDFLVAGTQKGGTTALYDYLARHPQLCMAASKELHFFDDERLFADAQPDYALYHRCFAPAETAVRIGEATPSYMFWHAAPRRIWDYNPRMRLIVLLRNPITRAFSHWHMEAGRQRETLGFLEAVQTEPKRARAALPLQHRVFSYLARGFYTEQLRRLWFFFPPENVLVLKSDWLRDTPAHALGAIARFLDIAPFPETGTVRSFAQTYSVGMRPGEHDALRAIFDCEIRCLERLLDWDCSDWLAG